MNFQSAEVLLDSHARELAAAGHYFENYVVGELLRDLSYGASGYNINYYRDRGMREIDVILEKDGVLHPLEIKKRPTLTREPFARSAFWHTPPKKSAPEASFV